MLGRLFQAFGSREDPDAAWIARRGVEHLVKLFRATGLQVVPEGGRLSIAGAQIELHVDIEQKLQQQGGEHVVAAAFRVAINREVVPAFVAGAVGADATIEGARAQTAGMWFAQYGSPIGCAIARWLGAEGDFPGVDIDGETLYHGSIAIRSDANYGETASVEFVRDIGRRAIPLMGDQSRFRSATIKVFVHQANVKDGECLINGSVSPALLNTLRKVSWPEGHAPFIYTLFFVAPPVPR